MRKLDRTDIGILNALQENARITNADLARSVNLSPTPCFNRVKAMEELGLIREQVTLLDPDLLGLHVNVFIHVSLEKQNELALQQFEGAISDRPEVMECYLMAGDPDYLIRVLVIAAGAVLSVQAAINGRLGQTVGVLRSSLLTFAVGALTTALLIFFFEPAQAISLLDVPKWQLTGALFGVVYMMVMVGAVPIVGTAVATVAVIVGQLGMGMLIDNFGWLGNPAIELSGSRVVAMLLLALALVFMYRSNTRRAD